jgi:hypothetical protein
MEKTVKYKTHEIRVKLIFNATEYFVRDKNDRNKFLTVVTYDYSQKITIDNVPVLNYNGQTFYDEYTQNLKVDVYKQIVLDNGIVLGKSIIDSKI